MLSSSSSRRRPPSDLLQQILQNTAHEKLVFLIFSGAGCYVCSKLRQHLPWFADAYRQQIDVVLVDAKKYSRLATEYGVHTIPTVMVYKRGIRMLKETGVGSRERLQEMLQMAIQSA